jgi:TPR repeat protein
VEDAVAQPATEASPKSEAVAENETGQDEFNAAREILRGKTRRQDLSKAVDLLWAGVRKGYVPAEVTLADLFRRGDGVEKNCDQARVLLVAASKKGSTDARQMLEKMAEQGCD